MCWKGEPGPQGEPNAEITEQIERVLQANPDASPEELLGAIRQELPAMNAVAGFDKAQELRPIDRDAL